MTESIDPGARAGDVEPARTCPWCSAPAAAEDIKCRACGAALAQRESLAGVSIPGLTAVDPALAAFDAQPMHLRGPSPSQGLASGAMVAAVAGGPIGLAAIGGFVAVAAVEYLGNRHPDGSGPVDLETVGQPGGLALMALHKVEHEGELGTAQDAAEPGPQEASAVEPTAAAESDPWRDLDGDVSRG